MNTQEIKITKKEFFKEIISAVWAETNANLEGGQFVRIFLYKDAAAELLESGQTEKDLCGAHFFSSDQWNDIDQENQIEIYSFEQSYDEIYDEEDFSRQFDMDVQESINEAYIELIYNEK